MTAELEVSEVQIRRLRSMLTGADFTTEAVCRRTGIGSIYDFRSIREGRTAGVATSDALDLLIRLFMDVELVERGTIEALLSPEERRLLEDLRLIRVSGGGGGDERWHASLLLYPTESIWIASDLNVSPTDSGPSTLREDAVYPAITKNTRHFLASLPTTACGTFLELCAGTGIAALLASRYAGRTWAADITDRATRFARFNAALNGIENCTAVQGDLYSGVAGLRFDRIVAHPPYMPSLEQKYIFRDGGEDGEQITRGVVGGLPAHLARGGTFHCTCMLTDRKEAPAEERLRSLLGEEEREFDIILLAHQSFHPTEYYFQLALAGRATLEEVQKRHEIFRRLEVERLVYASIVLRRHDGTRRAYTARRQAGPNTGYREVDWLHRWEEAAAGPDLSRHLKEVRPAVAGDCRMRLSHVSDGGAWTVEECALATTWPFPLEAKVPPLTVHFLTRCDGRRTVSDHFAWLKAEGLVPPEIPEEEFATLVRLMLAGGFLEVSEFPLPQR